MGLVPEEPWRSSSARRSKMTGSSTAKGTKTAAAALARQTGQTMIGGAHFMILVTYLLSFGFILYFAYLKDSRNAMIDFVPTVLTPDYELFVFGWIPVGVSCGIFVIFTFLPSFRESELIHIASPYFGVVMMLQAWWAFDINGIKEGEGGSLGVPTTAIFLAACFSLGCLMSMDMKVVTFWEYWFMRAPFSILASWLVSLAMLTANMYAAQSHYDSVAHGTDEKFSEAALLATAPLPDPHDVDA